MKTQKYLLILIISLFLNACTSMNGSQKITSSDTNNVHLKNATLKNQSANKQSTTAACTLQKNSLKDRRESFLFDLFRINNNQETTVNEEQNEENANNQPSASQEINHALELCTSAQDAWEKGDADKALNHLDSAYASILDLDSDDSRVLMKKEELRFTISKRVMEISTSRKNSVKGEYKEIPITMNTHVQNEINNLTGSEKEFFINSMTRAAEYRPYILKELKDAGLPEELSWLPLIESGFKVKALSPARALGLWQFIPSTGYKFGLNRDYYIDERMDPIKSTKAAVKYLTALHQMFGDWSTVLAAYNCGEGKVLRTIRSQNINYLDNFWDLYAKLPQETARYVPRFIATLHIINNLEKYGFNSPKHIKPIEFELVTVNRQLKLKDIARKIDVSYTILETLNPELKYGILPSEEYQLKIPADKMDSFFASINDVIPSEPVSPANYISHKVKRGETLFSIAKNYGVKITDIAAANNIPAKSSVSTGNTLKIPESANENNKSATYNKYISLNNAGNTTKEQEKGAGKRENISSNNKRDDNTALVSEVKYKVKKGDTMWSIAKKYNTTPDAIKSLNSISNSMLNLNQEIIIAQTLTAAKSTKNFNESYRNTTLAYNKTDNLNKNQKSCKQKPSTHWVKSGDTLFTIAQKYNMTVQRLFDINRLSKESKIFPGQKILVD